MRSAPPFSLMGLENDVSLEKSFSTSDSLFKFQGAKQPFKVRDSFEGILIFGSTGSGKSSSSGELIASSYLEYGYGGLVLPVKEDELALWKKRIQRSSREKSFIEFDDKSGFCYNFLEIESRNNNVINIVDLLQAAVNSERGVNAFTQDYWSDQTNLLLKNLVTLIFCSKEKISFRLLFDVIQSLPNTPEESQVLHQDVFYVPISTDNISKDGYKNLAPLMKEDTELSAFIRLMRKSVINVSSSNSNVSESDLCLAYSYFFKTLPAIHEKTRTIFVSMIVATIDSFLREPLSSLFDGKTNIDPSWIYSGAIIYVNLPVHTFKKTGRIANAIWKYCFQQELQKRKVVGDSLSMKSRPVFLWVDEAQYLISSKDSEFQTTARSSLCSTVYLSQNIPNYRASLGSSSLAKDLFNGLKGNMKTRIFHQNSDEETNKETTYLANFHVRQHFLLKFFLSDQKINELKKKNTFDSSTIFNLKTGGKENKYTCEAIVCPPNSKMFGKKSYLKCKFHQKSFKKLTYSQLKVTSSRYQPDFKSYIDEIQKVQFKIFKK